MTGPTDEQHARLAAMLTEAAGLAFYGQRREALAHGVRRRLTALAGLDVDGYLERLVADRAEMQALLDEVTVQETQFFRNPPQIRALRRHVLPEIVRRAADDGTRRIRVWSAGCSTGEEPYTVAMLLRELVPASQPGWDIRVLATDVSTRAVEASRRARYAPRSLRLTEDVDRDRWLVPVLDEAAYAVRDEVRGLVDVHHHNVVTDAPPCEPGELDLVLCRNVTIYLTREATRALVSRLHGCLRDGGYLFLGHAETLWQVSDEFALVPLGDAFVYRRVDTEPAERRSVLPDRRTQDEPWPHAERRVRARRAPAPTAEERLAAARAAVADGAYAHAADLALEVATVHPLDPAVHYLRGLALATAGADEDAVVSLRKAAYLDPGHGLAHFVLAGALERLGQGAAAASAYRTAAQTLRARPPAPCADELGGRAPAELADLSLRLAQRAETN